MNRALYLLTALVFMTWTAGSGTAFAQLFGSDDKNWEKVLVELKKINARLVSVHNKDLPTIHGNQADLMEQVGTLKRMMPGLEGKMEELNTNQSQQLGQVSAHIDQIESWIKGELTRQAASQQGEMAAFKKDMATAFDQLKVGMAQDIETFAKSNQAQFQVLSASNDKSLAAMKTQLDNQTDRVDKVISTLTQILDVNTKQYQALTARLDGIQQTITVNQKTLAAGFAAIETNNRTVNSNTETITQVLKKGFTEQAGISQKVGVLEAELSKAQGNVELTRKAIGALKEILAPKLDRVAQVQVETQQSLATGQQGVTQHLSGLQEGQKQMAERFNKLVEGTQGVITNSGQIGDQLRQIGGHVDSNRNEVDLANQKLGKLIDILKTMAAEQGKLENLVGGQGKILAKLESGGSGSADVTEALADLRRKANVNIARNDSILNYLKDQAKPTPPPAGN